MGKVRTYLTCLIILFLPLSLMAQATVTGTVTVAETGEGLAGANVVVEGTTLGAAADASGMFRIENVPAGGQTVTASVIGYEESSNAVNVPASGSVTVDFQLVPSIIELSPLEVFASFATAETPVAVSTIDREEMQLRLGSRDIPLVLNTTPSVYATAQGGGAGDARVNIRGFNQRNVAIMINGVPVNDMENAWVYWSNWDGVGDATSSIQVQRGLSAVNLATPSIGGTMNIITDPASRSRTLMFKQEVGSWNFLKSTLSLHSGLIGGKFAVAGTLVKKTGDGFYNGTWTDAYAYYLGASYQVSSADRFEFYALGAPQRHGQNLYKQNIAAYSHKLAKELGFSQAALDKFPEAGKDWNENYGKVSSSYAGKQFWAMYSERMDADRYGKNFLNERENFFHKPQVNLNWYHTFTDRMLLSSVVYWSGGQGGGTGTKGSVKWDYSGPSRVVDYDATVAANQANEKGSKGILRNSNNFQWTIGAVSKLNLELSDKLKTIFGVDWRTAEISHFRTVRDLLGGDYYQRYDSDFWGDAGKQLKLGDKFDYNNTNTVDWFGAFGQTEFRSGPISAYGMAGYSTISYTFTDHFADDGTGKELYAENKGIPGFQVKGGGLFRLSDGLGIYANLGLVSKVPIFDNAINDRDGSVALNPENENFQHIELGVNTTQLNGQLTVDANYYNTTWLNRSNLRSVINEDGSESYIFLTGMDANHSGFEVEAAFRPMSLFRVDASVGLGNWVLIDDVKGQFKTYAADTAGILIEDLTEYRYYVKDLKVGDAPQTQIAVGVSLFPIPGLTAQVWYSYYASHFSDWDPFSRTDPDDKGQSWEAPSYGLIDFHATYDLPLSLGGVRLQAFAHVFNVLDELYIQDAVDNSRFNAFRDDGKNHKADDAEVFIGMPRTVNAGLSFIF